jgi:hypothetical protein
MSIIYISNYSRTNTTTLIAADQFICQYIDIGIRRT